MLRTDSKQDDAAKKFKTGVLAMFLVGIGCGALV